MVRRQVANVRSGSLAVVLSNISRMSAFEGKADVRQEFSATENAIKLPPVVRYSGFVVRL